MTPPVTLTGLSEKCVCMYCQGKIVVEFLMQKTSLAIHQPRSYEDSSALFAASFFSPSSTTLGLACSSPVRARACRGPCWGRRKLLSRIPYRFWASALSLWKSVLSVELLVGLGA